MNNIKIGILGYGNLGRGVEAGVTQNSDMELTTIITRRNPDLIKPATEGVNVIHSDNAREVLDNIDVLIMCSGSMKDLPIQGPEFAKLFNTVDGFDTHAKIPDYFEVMDRASKDNNKTSVIASGWDPGLFSLNRLMANVVLPEGKDYTFWGKGVSQGHSDAIRMLEGVKDARQYTVPVESVMQEIREGSNKEYTTREKHLRVCYVVAEDNANRAKLTEEIKKMPNYFADYNTEVHFITEEELLAKHSELPHGGFVIRGGATGLNREHKELIEYRLKLDSNPEFTANVLLAYARAVYRLNINKDYGCKTVFDIAPGLLSIESPEYLRKHLL